MISRFIVAIGLLGCAIALAQTPDPRLAPLLRVPDLSPQVSSAEVAKEFDHWTRFVQNRGSKFTENNYKDLEAARASLAPCIPRATKLTLYSLYPVDAPNLAANLKGSELRIAKLPLFHDYPILGSIVIDNADEAQRWSSFLRDQIVPAGSYDCGFMPRHGFRFSTSDGKDVDILVCFTCEMVRCHGAEQIHTSQSPILSSTVKTILNQLFDKLKIERDETNGNR